MDRSYTTPWARVVESRYSAGGLHVTAEDLGLPESVPCAFCGELETELCSGFGSQLSVATYWCRRCRTAFEYVKWQRTSK